MSDSSDSTGRTERYQLRPERRGKWWPRIRRLIVIAAILALHAAWGDRAETRLDREVMALAAAGEPTTPEWLSPSGLADSDNAAIELRAAAETLCHYGGSSAIGKAWETDPAPPLTRGEAECIASLLKAHGESLARTRAARSKRGAQWRVELASPLFRTWLPDRHRQEELASLAGLAALYETDRGNDGAALEYIRDVLFISRAIDHQPFLPSHDSAIRIACGAANRLSEIAPELDIQRGNSPGSGAASAEQVRILIAELLDDSPWREGLRRAFRGARVQMLDAYRGLADGRTAMSDITGGRPTASEAARDCGVATARAAVGAMDVVFPNAARPMIFSDGALMVRHFNHVMEVALDSRDWQTAKGRGLECPAEIQGSLWRESNHIPARLLRPHPEYYLKGHYRGAAARRMAATALALRWYAVEHGGELPARLDDLVPRYLPYVPADPMASGEPLGYLPDLARPVIYSVGPDGFNDGGFMPDHGVASLGQQGTDDVIHLRRQPRQVVEPSLVWPDGPVLVPATPTTAKPASVEGR